jgi:3-oxoacyl-[acyl-carrier-protein] synthase III
LIADLHLTPTKIFEARGEVCLTVIDRLANSTGIMQRFYAPDSWATSDLAVPAAKEALKRAGRKPEDVDLIIVGTTSPDASVYLRLQEEAAPACRLVCPRH